jgi:transposase InsO family protein
MEQVARNATMEGTGYLHRCRYLLHDRDTKFCREFRETLAAGGEKCLALAARSPNLNSYAERWVRSIKEECLSRLILFGEQSLQRAVSNSSSAFIMNAIIRAGAITAAWTSQQIVEAFAEHQTPRYLLRDRDGVYANDVRSHIASLQIQEILTAPRSPWQNPYAERLIGSIPRECLDHFIILNARHLKRTLASYLSYYHG